MKIFKNGHGGEYCLFAISIKPQTIKQLKTLNLSLEKKYKLKFGDSFIARTMIEESLKMEKIEQMIVDKRLRKLIKGSS